jgi:hypothetical protein
MGKDLHEDLELKETDPEEESETGKHTVMLP